MADIHIRPVGASRPANIVSDTEKQVFDLLEELKIPYTCVENDSVDTMEECLAIDEALGTEVRKTIFLTNRKKTVFFLVVLPAAKRLDTSSLEKKLGCGRLSFASADRMREMIGLVPGEASVMGLLHDTENRIQLIVDQEVSDSEWFGCNPATNTAHIRMKTKDLMDVFLPAIHHRATVMAL
jgi:Ala-tRNA(Pro) deacylase